MDRTKFLLAAASLAGLLAALFFLTRVSASEAPTIEQVLAPGDVAEIERIRNIFGSEPDVVLIAIRRDGAPVPRARLQAIEAGLLEVDGVARTWSTLPTAGVIAVALEPGTVQLTRARALTAALDEALARATAPGESTHVVGAPQLRVASWKVVEDDLALMLPLLVLVVVVIPLVFFASPGAVLFPLVMAALTSSVVLIAHRVFSGPLNALVILLIPMVWSIATLDAMHLYYRVRRTGDVAAARAELLYPCLLTTVTTAGGLAALAVQDESQLIRSFGLWAAAGTCLAYILTFTVGNTLLSLSRGRPAPPRWPARLALSVMLRSRRHPGVVVIAWAALAVAAGVFVGALRVEVRFPRVFAPDHPVTRELHAMQDVLGTDLSPLEIYIEPTDEHGRRAVPLASALALVSHYMGTLPETRLVLPQHLLGEETLDLDRERPVDEQLVELGKDPRFTPWIPFDKEAARLQVHFAPLSFARRNEIIDWVRHFDKTMLSHHRLSLGGPGYYYPLAERRALYGTWVGGGVTLLVVVFALAGSLRRLRLFAVGLVGNLLPLLLVAGAMGATGLPWSLAMLPLPAVLLGLAVDDTVHLLWPLRGGGHSRRIYRGAVQSGPALLATTTVLAACIATMMLSGLQVNRELGLLLPAGILLALLCDLSLVPALLTSSRRR